METFYMLTVGPVTPHWEAVDQYHPWSVDMLTRRCLFANSRALPTLNNPVLNSTALNTAWG
jgi:hypothetical protein